MCLRRQQENIKIEIIEPWHSKLKTDNYRLRCLSLQDFRESQGYEGHQDLCNSNSFSSDLSGTTRDNPPIIKQYFFGQGGVYGTSSPNATATALNLITLKILKAHNTVSLIPQSLGSRLTSLAIILEQCYWGSALGVMEAATAIVATLTMPPTWQRARTLPINKCQQRVFRGVSAPGRRPRKSQEGVSVEKEQSHLLLETGDSFFTLSGVSAGSPERRP